MTKVEKFVLRLSIYGITLAAEGSYSLKNAFPKLILCLHSFRSFHHVFDHSIQTQNIWNICEKIQFGALCSPQVRHHWKANLFLVMSPSHRIKFAVLNWRHEKWNKNYTVTSKRSVLLYKPKAYLGTNTATLRHHKFSFCSWSLMNCIRSISHQTPTEICHHVAVPFHHYLGNIVPSI